MTKEVEEREEEEEKVSRDIPNICPYKTNENLSGRI